MRTNPDNMVFICGQIMSGFAYSHKIMGESFYNTELAVKRLSGTVDIIPLVVSDRLFDCTQSCKGKFVDVSGEFRRVECFEESKPRVSLFVFAQGMALCSVPPTETNVCQLSGRICKKPVLRETPGGRIICDLYIQVDRLNPGTDYLPCIVWGRNAIYASRLDKGTRITVTGRIQSRDYTKMISETEFTINTAYELSAIAIEVNTDEEN